MIAQVLGQPVDRKMGIGAEVLVGYLFCGEVPAGPKATGRVPLPSSQPAAALALSAFCVVFFGLRFRCGPGLATAGLAIVFGPRLFVVGPAGRFGRRGIGPGMLGPRPATLANWTRFAPMLVTLSPLLAKR
jgi:hypothetical protein